MTELDPRDAAIAGKVAAEVVRTHRRRMLWKGLLLVAVVLLSAKVWIAGKPYKHRVAITAMVAFATGAPLIVAFMNARSASTRRRRVYKRINGFHVSGVCRGISEAFPIPAWLLRLLFLALLVYSRPIALAVYCGLDLILPVHPDDRVHLLRFRIARWWRGRRG
jgi:phage shock protein PspC (stress-responsive transcriptional regulator)